MKVNTIGIDVRGSIGGVGISRQIKFAWSVERADSITNIQIGMLYIKGTSVSRATLSENFPIISGPSAVLFVTDSGLSSDVDLGAYYNFAGDPPATVRDMEGSGVAYGGSITPRLAGPTFDLEVSVADSGVAGVEIGLGAGLSPLPINVTAEVTETQILWLKEFEF